MREPMNQTIAQLHERKSVRVFTEEPVSASDERAILEAACQAPTAGNQQLYSIIVVRDQAKRERLAETCDHQPFIAKAPLVLAFVADARRWWRGFGLAGAKPREPGVGDFVLSCQDALIAAQNATTAAWSLGIGSCYIGDVLERGEEQAQILGCPRYVVPVTLLVLGHPTEGQRARRKPERASLDEMVFEDAYVDVSDEHLRADLGRRQGADLVDAKAADERLRAFCARKWNSDFAREMNRSVAAMLAAFDGGRRDGDVRGEGE
ncbi:nitroreductase family protein [Thermophilibacter immobilis]|jgi:nitroreductase/FMN reductase (NADPH)/FMN reductase [NAD(P)H]|nr:nitroreductase family protein [Thermophilibacter immobilis]